MKLVVVNGQPETGKDTFVDRCIDTFRRRGKEALKVSSVDRVKEAAKLLGWHGEKDATARKFLSDLKDMSTAVYEGPMKYMEECIEMCAEDGDAAVFFMIREPHEIKKFVERFPTTITMLVTRGSYEANQSNHADLNVSNYPYNVFVRNDGQLYELMAKADGFVDFLEGECHAPLVKIEL